MKTTTFQIVLLSVFGALAVAGVLVFAIVTTSTKTQSIGPVTIWGPWSTSAVTSVIRAAADANPQLQTVSYVSKDPSTYENDLAQALASGSGPDLFIIRQDYAFVDASKAYVIPYTQFAQSQFKNTFVDSADAFLGKDGIVAIPLVADPLVLYWNRDMLTSAGFAQPPQTWDQFFDIASKVTKRDDAGNILQSGVALGSYDNVANAKDILALIILQSGGVITSYDAQGILDSAILPHNGGSVQSAATALRFYTGFADASKSYYSWNGGLASSTQAFADGNLAVYLGYASEAQTIAAMNPNLNFGIAPVPQISGSNTIIDVARVYGIATAKAGKNQAGALTAAALLTGTDISAAFSQSLGIPSARRDVLATSEATGNELTFEKAVIASHTWTDPDPQQTDAIFRAMIDNVVSGAALVDDAVSQADQQLSQFLQQVQVIQ